MPEDVQNSAHTCQERKIKYAENRRERDKVVKWQKPPTNSGVLWHLHGIGDIGVSYLICDGIVTPLLLCVRFRANWSSAFTADIPVMYTNSADIINPVRPLPALQWIPTAVFIRPSGFPVRYASTSSQNSIIMSNGHGLWSSNPNRVSVAENVPSSNP